MLAIVALATLACIVFALTYRIADYDLWELLAFGRGIWGLKHVPTAQIWTWPVYGAPDINVEWGFEVLQWPLWRIGGLTAIYVWNWVTALIAFGLVWITARAMGARGFTPLLVIAIAALTYRQRSVGRPETLSAVWLAAEICVLELHRRRGGRVIWLLPAIALLWVNTHITYVLGIVVALIYFAGESLQRPAGGEKARASTAPLALAILAALVVSVINPFGLAALSEPIRYAAGQRHEPLYRSIGELMPLDWEFNRRNGLALLMLIWPVLQVWRTFRRRFDLVESMLCVLFTLGTLNARRLVGMWVLVASPFIARDLGEWLGGLSWPRWLRADAARAAATIGAIVVLSIPEWTRPGFTPGMGVDPTTYPAAACDFMRAHDIRGRGFNHFEFGGYLLYRFHPERDRLPFIDTRMSGTPEIRTMYLAALGAPEGWQDLDRRWNFDYALLRRLRAQGDQLADVLDADSSWALVFTDDAASLYVRRDGRFHALADSSGYALVPGGTAKLDRTWSAAMTDSVVRRRFERELTRVTHESRITSTAHSLLAYVAAFEARWEDARRALETAHAMDPLLPRCHDRMGFVLLNLGQPAAALAEFREAKRRGETTAADYEMGLAYLRMGDTKSAREAFTRSLQSAPDLTAASDSIRALDARGR